MHQHGSDPSCASYLSGGGVVFISLTIQRLLHFPSNMNYRKQYSGEAKVNFECIIEKGNLGKCLRRLPLVR